MLFLTIFQQYEIENDLYGKRKNVHRRLYVPAANALLNAQHWFPNCTMLFIFIQREPHTHTTTESQNAHNTRMHETQTAIFCICSNHGAYSRTVENWCTNKRGWKRTKKWKTDDQRAMYEIENEKESQRIAHEWSSRMESTIAMCFEWNAVLCIRTHGARCRSLKDYCSVQWCLRFRVPYELMKQQMHPIYYYASASYRSCYMLHVTKSYVTCPLLLASQFAIKRKKIKLFVEKCVFIAK